MQNSKALNSDVPSDLQKIISSSVFRNMRSLNLVDETELRNLMLKLDYKNLRSSYNSSKALEMLMGKYCLSDTTIIYILSHPSDKKSKTPLVFME